MAGKGTIQIFFPKKEKDFFKPWDIIVIITELSICWEFIRSELTDLKKKQHRNKFLERLLLRPEKGSSEKKKKPFQVDKQVPRNCFKCYWK